MACKDFEAGCGCESCKITADRREEAMRNESCDRHNKYDGSWWANDARGIPLARVCDRCIDRKLERYRPEVMNDPSYEADEPIEESDW